MNCVRAEAERSISVVTDDESIQNIRLLFIIE